MSLDAIAVQFLNGLAGASTLFLIAVGLSLIFGVTRIVNFAHGSFYMLGIYVAYTVVARIGGTMFGFWASVLIAALAVAVIGVIVGEFVAGSKGLGFQILTAQGQFDTVRVFVSLVLLGIVGTLLFFLVDYAERMLLPWHVSQRGRRDPA